MSTSILILAMALVSGIYGAVKAMEARNTLPEVHAKYGQEYCINNGGIPAEARLVAFRGIAFSLLSITSLVILVFSSIYFIIH